MELSGSRNHSQTRVWLGYHGSNLVPHLVSNISVYDSFKMRLLHWNLPWPRTPSSFDFERVIIPLEDAHLHSYSARLGTESPDLMKDPDVDEGGKDTEHEETGMLEMSVSEYSIEGLRREVRKGARGAPSQYERMLTWGRASSHGPKIRQLQGHHSRY